MIKFFRKIRYDLMEKNLPSREGTAKQEGKTGKYLKYAIGEVVLVVFGILIALQINNWNVNLKNNRLKDYYMKSLVEDLSTDTLNINRVAKWQESEIHRLQNFKDRIYGQSSITIDTIQNIAQFEFKINYLVKRDYNNNTFKTIISSGNIDLFDLHLINELMLLEAYQLDEIKRSKNNLTQYDILSNKYSARYPTLSTGEDKNNFVEHLLWNNIDEKDFVGNFIAILDSKLFSFKNTLRGQSRVKDKSTEILLLIEQLINKDRGK